MFQGSGFAIPGLLVAFLTIGIGGIGVLAGWFSILGNDQSKTSLTTIPYALYSLALSVAVQVSGLLVTHHLNHQSYDLAQRPVLERVWSSLYSNHSCWQILLCASLAGYLREGHPARQHRFCERVRQHF